MDEATGCRILKEQFTQAGLAIEENYPLHEDSICFNVDGFDPAARIGYEYITTEAGDRSEITPQLIAALEARMQKGEPATQGGLYIFLIDEHHVEGPAELRSAAAQFLARVQPAGGSRG